MTGLEARMRKELNILADGQVKINAHALPNAQNAAWIGGNLFAATEGFRNMRITKAEYDEDGPTLVNTRCLQ